ncbi:MAG: PQQ-dependent sugar dehydrogenase [Woeseiaceae bacterium]|nr:PQQ-dependent sugar dehydrogenase [Woeseiaceae bacterium]
MRAIAGKIWTLAAVPILLTACGGGGGGGGGTPPVTPPTPPPTTTPGITVSQAFTSLPAFVQPTVLKQAPGDDARWFVGEKRGRILVFANNPNSSSSSTFLDIEGLTNPSGEGGLLGIAFHPDFPTTPEVYVSYTRDGAPLESHVSRFTSNDGGQTLLAASEEIIFTVLQPETNHNGGDIAFGPDGFLYVSFGDGGGGGDPREYGQDDNNLHGTIVRIDVDGAAPYEIPPGNPNASNGVCTQGFGGAPCPEIFAWGLRNPWRISFDRVTGRLWTGDVGQGAWEEIDVIVNGGNYGWNDREGANCFDPPSGCATNFTEPVTEYGRSLGQSVTGGYVYRGATDSDLIGWYVFGDFVSGRIFAVPEDSTPTVTPEVLLDTPNSIVTFAEDVDGELYFADFNQGTIYRVEDAP